MSTAVGRYAPEQLDRFADEVRRESYCVLRHHLNRDLVRAWADAFAPLLDAHVATTADDPNRGPQRFYVTLPFAGVFADPRIVFSVAWARSGYLPTHNPDYSKPQGKDPTWNAANCRNRRIFNDRAVQKVGANTKPFLLQTYRRDMGGGKFVLMKDMSSPIFVNGRHWGAFRIGFRHV